MPCLRCEAQPNFHSFLHLGTSTEGFEVFYSKPSLNVEKTFTEEMVGNFLSHMDQAAHHGKWIYLFDAQGLEKLQLPNFTLMKRFQGQVQERYKDSLVHIYIVNRNWAFELVYNILYPFMSKHHRDLYVFCKSPVQLLSRGIPTQIVQRVFSSSQ